MKNIFFMLLLFISQVAWSQIWVPARISNMPKAISNNAVSGAVVNNGAHMYSFGGIDTSKKYSGITLESFKWNASTDVWSIIPPLPDTLGKIAAAASTVKNKIYIIGGYHVYVNGSEKSSARVHRFDPVTDTYFTDGADIPIPIDDQVQCVWRDSLIYVISGWSNTGNVNNVQVYNPTNDSWGQATVVPNNNIAVFGAQGIIRNDTIYYYGGASMGVGFLSQSLLRIGVIDSLNPMSINWLPLFNYLGHPLYRMVALANPDGNISFLGGSSISYNYDGVSYTNNQGVPPANEQITFNVNSQTASSDYSQQYPMDLRGYANYSMVTKFICGGMLDSQQVTNHAYRLDYYQTVGTSDLAKKIGIKVYPNPTVGELNVYMESKDVNLRYEILNATCQKVTAGKIFSGNNRINISQLASGNYYIIFNSKGERFVERIIKK